MAAFDEKETKGCFPCLNRKLIVSAKRAARSKPSSWQKNPCPLVLNVGLRDGNIGSGFIWQLCACKF